MAEDEVKNTNDTTGQNSDEGTQNTDTGDGDLDVDGQDKKKLEESSKEEMADYLRELRKENKEKRLANLRIQKELDALPELRQKLKDLEDKDKTEEEKKAERLKELETTAQKVPTLSKYEAHVKKLLGERTKQVKEMDEDVQASINSLLEDMPKEDFLGRLKVIDAVLAVSGVQKKEDGGDMSVEDTGNPAETGDGDASRTLAQDLAYSPLGMQEAEMAGLVKSKSE